jgi:hypothetical protein
VIVTSVPVVSDHLAQYVVARLGTMLALVIWVPPVAALVLNQPAKEKPDLAFGYGSVPNVVPGVWLEVGGEPDPPL